MAVAQQSCKARWRVHKDDRIADLRKLWRAYSDGNEDGVPDIGNLNEYGLGFDYVAAGTFRGQREGYFRYQLSWGGPSDEFRFYVGADLEPYRVGYSFMDWFDGAHRNLRGKDLALLLELWHGFFDACDLRGMVDAAHE